MTSEPHTLIASKIGGYIQDTLLGGRAVAHDENLLLSGLLDSLAVMSLVAHIEDTFDIKIPFGDVLIENFETIDAIASYLKARGVHV